MSEPSDAAYDRNAQYMTLLHGARRQLLAYLVALLGNRHDAEDVLQQASLTMWRRFEAFEPGTNFLAWASTVAFYEARNFQRTAGRSRLQFSEELLKTLADERLPDLAELEPRLAALDGCLAKLDAPGRKLVQTAYLGEGTIAALAAELGRAPQTLYNKLNLLRRMLAECVERTLMESRGV